MLKGHFAAMEELVRRPDLVLADGVDQRPNDGRRVGKHRSAFVAGCEEPARVGATHIDASVNVPLNYLQERIAEIPRNRRIAVHCAGGYRSLIAASILHQYGITDVIKIAGDLAAWDAAFLTLNPAGS